MKILILIITMLVVYAGGGVLEDLQPGHWAAVSTNTIEDLDPEDDPGVNPNYPSAAPWHAVEGISGLIDDWNGGAFASGFGTKGGLVVFGGGHNGYFGNEIYVFDLGTLAWERVTDPTYPWTLDYTHGELATNEPMSAHTYDYMDYHPNTNSFIMLGSASNHVNGGGGAPYVHMFSFDSNEWRRCAAHASISGLTGASTAYDPTRDVFWLIPAYYKNFSSYDPDANSGNGQWTEHYRINIDIDAVSAVDPDHDLLVTLDCRSRHQVLVHDLKNPATEGAYVTTTGDKTLENGDSPGFEWDPVAHKFVGWDGGTSVYTLSAPDGDWKTGSWVWQKVSPAPSNTVTPSSPNSNGTYSRWRHAPSVNVFVVINRTTDQVYAYKHVADNGTGADPEKREVDRLTVDCLPNPFNARVKIAVSCPALAGSAISKVDLEIFNINGKLVKDFSSSIYLPSGRRGIPRTLYLQAEGLSPGIYILRVKTGNRIISKKLFLQK